MEDRHAVLLSATLLIGLTVTVILLPEFARDFALVVLAMSALGSALFFWSRRTSDGSKSGRASAVLEDLWPSQHAVSTESNADDGYGFLCRTVCALTGAAVSGIMLLDNDSGDLRFVSPWVAKTSTGFSELKSGPDLKRGDDPQLDSSIRMRQTRIVDARPFASVLQSIPNYTEVELWAVPLAYGSRVYGALLAGTTAQGFLQNADAYLAAVSTFAARIVASEQTRDICLERLRRTSLLSAGMTHWGPHCSTENVKASLLAAAQEVLETELVAVFIGADEHFASDRLASLNLDRHCLMQYGAFATDPGIKTPIFKSKAVQHEHVEQELSECLHQHGIESFIACPMRPGSGLSGAIVGFYRTATPSLDEIMDSAKLFADVAGLVLSYALAMEQSGRMRRPCWSEPRIVSAGHNRRSDRPGKSSFAATSP